MSRDLKARLLAGAARTDQVWVAEFGEDVPIRALTDLEQGEVDARKVKGLTVRTSPGEDPEQAARREQSFDGPGTVEGERLARRMTAAYGMSVDGAKWTPAEVGKLPPSAVVTIARAVDRLSGSDQEGVDATRQFRGDSGGSDDGGAASDRGSAGEDAG